MASDRGTTMHRGAAADAAAQEPWAQPTAPSARKLPGASRERKPALAALAVLLILGGALAVGYVMLQGAKRVAAIEITQQVGQGQQIPLSAMQEVQVAANSGVPYVPWAEAGQVSRNFAATTILKGTLLTSTMVAATNPEVSGRATMGLALKDGQLPAGLAAGDHIDIYEVSDATEACPGQPGSLLSGDAIVLDVSAPSATSTSAVADVEVALNPATAGAVACNASNGMLSVAVAPGSFLSQNPAVSGSGSPAGVTPSQKATGSGTGAG
jgi:hypothetical protein